MNPNHLLGSTLEKLIDPKTYTTRKGTWYIALNFYSTESYRHWSFQIYKYNVVQWFLVSEKLGLLLAGGRTARKITLEVFPIVFLTDKESRNKIRAKEKKWQAIVTIKNITKVSRIRDPVSFWPLDPGCLKNQDPDPGSGKNISEHISELRSNFWVKNT